MRRTDIVTNTHILLDYIEHEQKSTQRGRRSLVGLDTVATRAAIDDDEITDDNLHALSREVRGAAFAYIETSNTENGFLKWNRERTTRPEPPDPVSVSDVMGVAPSEYIQKNNQVYALEAVQRQATIRPHILEA
jgi:hypothetical protein